MVKLENKGGSCVEDLSSYVTRGLGHGGSADDSIGPADLLPNRPKVPGTLSLHARSRIEQPGRQRSVPDLGTVYVGKWPRTAIIICDMWNTHTCSLSAQRVAAMAPRMNEVVSNGSELRCHDHSRPSDTMKFYEGTPQRQRMQRAPMASSPMPIQLAARATPKKKRNFPHR